MMSRDAVANAVDAFAARAVRAAVDRAVGLHAMADDGDAATRALRRQRAYRALEAVEDVSVPVRKQHRERLVVLVAASLASRCAQISRSDEAGRFFALPCSSAWRACSCSSGVKSRACRARSSSVVSRTVSRTPRR